MAFTTRLEARPALEAFAMGSIVFNGQPRTIALALRWIVQRAGSRLSPGSQLPCQAREPKTKRERNASKTLL